MTPPAGKTYWGRFLLPFGGSTAAIARGAVHVASGSSRIDDLGRIEDLRSRHIGAEEVGGTDHLVMPGLIDAHQHGRAVRPAEQGCWDETLELWLIQQLALERPDPVLSARVAAMRSLLGGVTTILHPHVTVAAGRAIEEALELVRAYARAGLRVVFGVDLRDRASFTYDDDDAFLSHLPDELRARIDRTFPPVPGLPLADLEQGLDALQSVADDTLVTIALAPRGPQWCTPSLLEWVADQTRRGVPVQVHASETRAQYGWFAARNDSPVRYLERHGVLSTNATLAHCVWLDQADVATIAESGAVVAHNPASNLRLQSGRAPIGALRAAGVPIGIGTDSTGIGEQADMFAEIRLARWFEHLTQGGGVRAPGAALAEALRGGASAAGKPGLLGNLRVGASADIVLLDWEALAPRGGDEPNESTAAAPVEECAARNHVTDVVVGGRRVVRNCRYERDDGDELETALREHVSRLKPSADRDAAVSTLRPLVAHDVDRLHRLTAGKRFVA